MRMFPTNNSGSTLVEQLIVTAVIGLLVTVGALVAPNMIPRYRLRNTTQLLAGDLMRARRQAVKQNQSMTVRFADAHTYTIWDDTNANGTVDLGETVDKTVDIHDTAPGILVTTGTPFPLILVYTSRGVPNAPLTLTVANGNEHFQEGESPWRANSCS